MSDEQPSWRDRFFGSASAEEPATDGTAAEAVEPAATDPEERHDSAAAADDEARVAATSVSEHDEHQPLVEHEGETGTAVLGERGDSPIEPTLIAPSTLRGPSHSATAPEDLERTSAGSHGDAAASSLEQQPDPGPAEPGDAAGEGPPPLVEPRRPSFGLRRNASDTDTDGAEDAAGDARSDLSSAEPAPTQAIDVQGDDDQATRAIDTHEASADTRVLDQQPAEERTRRFGIIRDEVPPSALTIDEEAARAAAGTPIVLVEEPVPPRRKGARAVGFAVAILATVLFAIVFAGAFFAVGYLFDRAFDSTETLQSLWLRPSFLLPVIVFLLAYWLITAIVNRAGWWAHVLGGFVVALLVYAAHIAGAAMEAQDGWVSYTAVLDLGGEELGQLLLAPLSVLAFVIAREMPVWVGGIVARRGRSVREWNRQAMDEFNAENAERLAAYERARG